MALRVLQFAVTIPAGTPENEPHEVGLALDNWDMEQIDLEVPPGPAGLMGFTILNNGVRWLPAGEGTWMVWDDVVQSWYVSDQPNGLGWAVLGYNTGTYDHTVTVRAHVNPPALATPAAPSSPTFTTTPIANQAVIIL